MDIEKLLKYTFSLQYTNYGIDISTEYTYYNRECGRYSFL